MLVDVTTMFNPGYGQQHHIIDADVTWLSSELSNIDKSFINIVDTESNLALIVPTHSIVSIKPVLKAENAA